MICTSLKAPPINDMPTGSPNTYPDGTVMLAYPETAANAELPTLK